MPLPLKDRQIGAVEYILKKMKGYENDENSREELVMRQKPESDYKVGLKQAVDEMFTAFESKDKESFEKGLRGFVSMLVDIAVDEHNMYYHKDEYKETKED